MLARLGAHSLAVLRFLLRSRIDALLLVRMHQLPVSRRILLLSILDVCIAAHHRAVLLLSLWGVVIDSNI